MKRTHCDLPDMAAFLKAFDGDDSFAYTKINHGFWDRIARAGYEVNPFPITKEECIHADKITGVNKFFEGGFVDDVTTALRTAARNHHPSLHLGFSLSAWLHEGVGAPLFPAPYQRPLFHRYVSLFQRWSDGLLLKTAVSEGTIVPFFERLSSFYIIFVGPEYLSAPFFDLVNADGKFIPIHPYDARKDRSQIEKQIKSALIEATRPTVVLLQAGAISTYWILRIHREHPGVRWVDGGLAFSICHPPDILKRPWGTVFRKEILQTYKILGGKNHYDPGTVFNGVSKALIKASSFPTSSPYSMVTKVAFVEDKKPDFTRVKEFLKVSAQQNHWANRGPVHEMLAYAFQEYFNLDGNRSVVLCANGGVALQTLARLHDVRSGKRLRWVVSAFSFYNLSRGYFTDSMVLDCDAQGLLSLKELAKLQLNSYDGIIVTNPFGLARKEHIDPYRDFSNRYDKVLLIDNASGLRQDILPVDYQSLSLHYTKPYGTGEGGLAVVPADEAELFYELISYREFAPERSQFWVNNGKLSDIAAAFHLDRLERSPEWVPLYVRQVDRIFSVCREAGFQPLLPLGKTPTVAMSIPFLTRQPITLSQLNNPLLKLGKYYRPLANFPQARLIYKHIVNVPSHPDVAHISADELFRTLNNISKSHDPCNNKKLKGIHASKSSRWRRLLRTIRRMFRQ